MTPPSQGRSPPVGPVYLGRDEIGRRVRELGVEIENDYATANPLLIAPLKSSAVFLADLSRAIRASHSFDLVELADYAEGDGDGVRLLKDVDVPLVDRHVLVVQDVVDTGLTLHFLLRTLSLRGPSSLAAVTLLDRPYRRLVDDLPLRYVGFTVPDELFAGYGLGLEERWRALPDIHFVQAEALPAGAIEAA